MNLKMADVRKEPAGTRAAILTPSDDDPVTRPLGSEQILIMAGCAWLTWFAFLACGVLLAAMPHRKALGWDTPDETFYSSLGHLTKSTIEGTKDAVQVYSILQTALPKEEHLKCADRATTGQRALCSSYHLVVAGITFTPLNVALLALAAGLIGGCASNLLDKSPIVSRIQALERAGLDAGFLRQRLAYLKEHPASAMIRAFVVYLVLVSGLYVATGDPFGPNSQVNLAQYLKLAGLVSLLSFLVGYDPSRMQQWIDMVPNPGGTANGISPSGPPAAEVIKHGEVALKFEAKADVSQLKQPADAPPERER